MMADQTTAPPKQTWSIRIKRFIIQNSLPLSMFIAIVIGLSWPLPGDFVHSLKIARYPVFSTFNICVIFFVNGLILRLSEVKESFSIYFISIYLYSVIMILFVTPLTGLVLTNIEKLPLEFQIGLVVWCTAPTPSTSSVAMTNAVNGSYVLALLVNVTSNGLGIITVPFILRLILQKFTQSVDINATRLFINLICTVLVPFMIALFFQFTCKKIRKFAQKYKVPLIILINMNAGLAAWQVISKSQERIIKTKFVSILMLLGISILMHLVFLMVNFVFSKIFKLGEKEKRTVTLVASSKSILIPLTVISYFGGDASNQGLLTVPVILSYITQLFIDSIIVSKWQHVDIAQQKATELQSVVTDTNNTNVHYQGNIAEQSLKGSNSSLPDTVKQPAEIEAVGDLE